MELTRDEYEARITALHSSLPAMPSKVEQIAVRRAELDLLIDYRLGALPRQRRDALWAEQCKLDRHLPWRLLVGFLTHPANPSDVVAKSHVRAFAIVLTPAELCALLDLSSDDLEKFLA